MAVKQVQAPIRFQNIKRENLTHEDLYFTNWMDHRLKTGGSQFYYIANSTEEPILNSVIVYKNGAQGRFLRVDRQKCDPFIFGAQCLPREDTKTLSDLGFTLQEARDIWDRVDIQLTDTPDYAGLTYAISLIGNGYNNIPLYGKTYVVTRDVPLGAAEGTSGMVNMEINGIKLIDLNTGNARKFI